MNNQAMGIEPNFDFNDESDMIAELKIAIPELEQKLKDAEDFQELYDSDAFQAVIIETLLGTEAEKLAMELLDMYVSSERKSELLIEIDALRTLKLILARKNGLAERLKRTVAENKQLLLDKMSR